MASPRALAYTMSKFVSKRASQKTLRQRARSQIGKALGVSYARRERIKVQRVYSAQSSVRPAYGKTVGIAWSRKGLTGNENLKGYMNEEGELLSDLGIRRTLAGIDKTPVGMTHGSKLADLWENGTPLTRSKIADALFELGDLSDFWAEFYPQESYSTFSRAESLHEQLVDALKLRGVKI